MSLETKTMVIKKMRNKKNHHIGTFLIGMVMSISTFAALPERPAPTDLFSIYNFDLITPTGEKLFRQSLKWESQQVDYRNFPQPRKCAVNVSKVMNMSGMPQYNSESVAGLLQSIIKKQGRYIKLNKDKYSIIEKLNSSMYDGNIPVGTVVGGCLYSDCFTGKPGDRHAALVAENGSDGTIYVIHNNWYRPENEGGLWKPHMVSQYFLNLGFKRQWMPTPWLKLIKDPSTGRILDVVSLLPKIDDLDPFQYFVSLALPKEIHDEILSGQSRSSQKRFKPFSKLNSITPYNQNLDFETRIELGLDDEFDVELDDDGSTL